MIFKCTYADRPYPYHCGSTQAGQPVITPQHRHDSPVDIIERDRLPAGAGIFTGVRRHDGNLPLT